MSDFNKFIGFLVLGLVCIVGIVGLDASNITDNKHSEKTMIYIMLSLLSSYFLYNSYKKFRIYRIYRRVNKKVCVQNDTSFCDVVDKAVLDDLEKDEYVIAYKNTLKRLQPEYYNKSK